MSSTAINLQSQILKQDALENTDSYPVFLTSVEVNGGENLSRQFFSKLLSPLVDKSDYTLSQLISQVNESSDNLEKTGVFAKIKPSLHADYTHSAPEKKSYNRDEPIVTKVIFDLDSKEMSVGNLALGFNNEDNLVVDLGYVNNNLNHNAESVKIGVNYRPYKPSEHLLSNMKLESNLRNPAFKFIIDVFNSHKNNEKLQQNSIKATGGLIGLQYLNTTKTFSLFNGLSLTKRSVYEAAVKEPNVLEQVGGDFLKSSIVSSLSYNSTTRLNDYTNEGFKLCLNNQISSDQESENSNSTQTTFMKTTGSLDLYKPLFKNVITAHLFKEVGFIFTNGSLDKIHLSDKFFLGGFDTFKGFSRNAVNEKGGIQFFKAGATFYGKVPYFLHRNLNAETSPMRLYATGMVGNVGDNILAESGAFSLGFGLRYINHLVKMDVGYYLSQRVNSTSTYGVRDGFKMEISLGGLGGTR